MIKIHVLYPNKKSAHFDLGYYLERHIPLSIQLLGAHAGYRGCSVERGLNGLVPGVEAPYSVICSFLFNSIEDFDAALAPHAEALQVDIQKFTDIQPVFQASEVLLSH